MKAILRLNATPVYAFLSRIQHLLPEDETLADKKILDCGAGGRVPPLVLFAQHGLAAYGIDISGRQLEMGQQFCSENNIKVDLRQGSMLEIPFPDDHFDYVYEHFAMCHLTHAETKQAVSEMKRVLKPGGMAFLGVISMDTWPKTDYGKETEPGHFLGMEHGEETLHSMFTDQEADALVQDWLLVQKEKRAILFPEDAEAFSLPDWMTLFPGVSSRYTEAEWESLYAERVHYFQYVHTYYFLKK